METISDEVNQASDADAEADSTDSEAATDASSMEVGTTETDASEDVQVGLPSEQAGDDSEIAPASDAEIAAASQSEAHTVTDAAKPGTVSRVMAGFKDNRKAIAACGCSLLLGAGGMFLFSGKPGPTADAEVIVEEVSYTAAINHRNEPIAPVVPFENLDTGVVLLGERLFHDPSLSRNGRISCASCHDVKKGGDDGRALPVGFDGAAGKMNSPTVLNSALNHTQFWDGRASTLEEQVDFPINDPTEMNSDWPRVVKFLTNNPRYNREFLANFGEEPTEALVRTALATYQRALLTAGSPFDKWLQGDETALSSDVYSGYHLFKKLNCVSCHNGENVGGHIFQPLGKVREYFTAQRPARDEDLGRFNFTGREEDKFVFRVPSLRNVELTAPYLHDGSAKTLSDAIETMIEYQVGAVAKAEDIRRIELFLNSLTAPTPVMPMVSKPLRNESVID